MFCRSLFVLWSFLFWPLCCLSFDLRILITSLWYLQTLPVILGLDCNVIQLYIVHQMVISNDNITCKHVIWKIIYRNSGRDPFEIGIGWIKSYSWLISYNIWHSYVNHVAVITLKVLRSPPWLELRVILGWYLILYDTCMWIMLKSPLWKFYGRHHELN